MNKSIKIKRPPLIKTFQLPTQNELLKVKKGNFVKIMFSKGKETERMWVKLEEKTDTDKWKGTLSNAPFIIELKHGDKITFHPLDVIDIDNNTKK